MESRRIVAGQYVSDEKLALARQLRKEMTPAERRLWSVLRGRRCEGLKFRRQQVIDGFVADFFCAEVGVVIELDGPIHEQQQEYDAARDVIIQHRQLTVLRFVNERVFGDLDAVLNEIVHVCRGRIDITTSE